MGIRLNIVIMPFNKVLQQNKCYLWQSAENEVKIQLYFLTILIKPISSDYTN